MRYTCIIGSGRIALAVAFAAPSIAQAQSPPDTVLGIDVSSVESLKGWVQTGTDWAGKFGDSGQVLRDATKGFDFSERWKTRVDRVAKLSERSRNALPTKLAPQLFQTADVINAVALPLLAGDGRGAVSGAVDLGATGAVSTAGTTGGEWLGATIGGTVGSWFPVVGNVVGATVGGAVGGFAGGYLAGAGYESYLKGSVANAVEAGIAMLVDPDPLVQGMRAHEAALYRQLSPELADMIRTSRSFGSGEMQLQDWGRLATPLQQQATLPPATSLPPMTRFEIRISSGGGGATVDDCRIDGEQVNCASRWESPPPWLVSYTGSFTGRLSGATVTGTTTSHITSRNVAGCTANEDYNGPVVFVLSAGGVAKLRAGPIQRRSTFSGSCSGANSGSSGPNEATAQWRVLQ